MILSFGVFKLVILISRISFFSVTSVLWSSPIAPTGVVSVQATGPPFAHPSWIPNKNRMNRVMRVFFKTPPFSEQSKFGTGLACCKQTSLVLRKRKRVTYQSSKNHMSCFNHKLIQLSTYYQDLLPDLPSSLTFPPSKTNKSLCDCRYKRMGRLEQDCPGFTVIQTG